MNKVIALVGMCGSGKSEVAKIIEQKGYSKVYFGGVTIEEVEKRGLEVTEENEKTVREELRKTYGMAAYAILNLPKIEEGLKKGNVLIDGLYSWEEYKILKNKFNDMIVLTIFTPLKNRYERLTKRPVRPYTLEQAKERDYVEIENLDKGGPIAISDYTIINDGTLEELKQKVEAFLAEVEK
ncbi:AAA family ATPase [Candidatus Woesearchaeota archaeon]|nr:AAA family ATPase [Candidatus Woesearchaeota archaeon]